MKLLFIAMSFALFTALPTSALASGGCYDGSWGVVSETTTEATVKGHWYGSFSLVFNGKAGEFTVKSNHPTSEFFHSPSYFIENLDSHVIVEILQQLNGFKDIAVKVTTHTWINRMEDECFGYPVGTRMRSTKQAFELTLKSGAKVPMESYAKDEYFNPDGTRAMN